MWKKTGRTYTGRSEKVFYLSNGGQNWPPFLNSQIEVYFQNLDYAIRKSIFVIPKVTII